MKWPVYVGHLLILLFVSCGMKTQSWWNESQIVVLAEQEDWIQIEHPLKAAFENVIRTPQPEKEYVVIHSDAEGYGQYRHARYLIIAATLESEGQIGDLVRRMLQDPDLRASVERGDQYSFVQRDPWARDQWMLVLAAKNIQSLKSVVETQGASFYTFFNDAVQNYLKKEMFERSEQKKVEKELMDLYGWRIRLQKDYFVAQAIPSDRMVWFRRTHPERWIFVRWIDDADTTGVFNRDWIVAERNRIGKAYYGNDRVADRFLFSYSSDFLGRPARVTTGLWENEEKVAGGPFRNYTFYDSISDRLYMIDIATWAPEYEKVPLLRRLDIIAKTFRTLFDRDPD